jgi:hypothetical protein
METALRDARGDVMNLRKEPERLRALAPCALVESLLRVVEDRPEEAPDVRAGFQSAL